jgi:hypothetical protein
MWSLTIQNVMEIKFVFLILKIVMMKHLENPKIRKLQLKMLFVSDDFYNLSNDKNVWSEAIEKAKILFNKVEN